MTLEVKAFRLDMDGEVDEAGRFKGYAAVFGNVDLDGDVIEPGAFTKTLDESGGTVPILYQHNPDEPIGFGKAAEDRNGLAVEGALNMEVSRAREVRALMKQAVDLGRPWGLSIGYKPVKADRGTRDGRAVRFLRELRMREFSPVIWPANPLARVTSVKNHENFEEALHELAVQLDAETKAGRVLSGANLDKLKAAIQLLQALLASAGAKDDGAADPTVEPDVESTLRSLAVQERVLDAIRAHRG